MLYVTEIRNQADFSSLRQEWNELLSRSDSDNFFLTWEWLHTWWQHYGEGKELRILLIRDGGRLIGVAPLFRYKRNLLSYQISFLGSTNAGSDYLDFIMERGREQEAMAAVTGHLKSYRNRSFTVCLADMPAQSKSVQLLQSSSNGDFRVSSRDHTRCPHIRLPGSYDQFLKSLSANMRSNIKRKRRRFEKDHSGEFLVASRADSLNHSAEEFIRLNMERMKAKKIDSPFGDARFSRFHNDLMGLIFDQGWLRLCFLRANGKPMAGLYVFKYKDTYYYYQSGFDPEWEKLSPGLLMFSYCIENAITEGMREFDFLQGEEKYKYQWTDAERVNKRVKMYRRCPGNEMRYLYDEALFLCKSRLKRIVKSHSMKASGASGTAGARG